MTEHDGRSVVDVQLLGAHYDVLIRELGTAIGVRSVLPPETLGVAGFEVSLDMVTAFPVNQPLDENGDRLDPNALTWDRAHVDEDAGPSVYQPGVTIRKGLPFSLEVGFSGRYIGASRQGVFSGFARAGLVEGFKPYPDVTLHLGYSGYVGNNELEVGAFDIGVTLGSTFAVGPGEGARNARITPYADFTLLSITSAPTVDSATASAVGAKFFGRNLRNPDPVNITSARPIVVPTFNGGVQVVIGKAMFRVTGGYGLRSVPHVSGSIGFTY
jgi:hypothetical protein